MKSPPDRPLPTWLAALSLLGLLIPCTVAASPITFEGTITYTGTHSADSLYVAAVDTAGGLDVVILDLVVYPVGAPPISQPFSLTFDNLVASPTVFIASFLDVDGGGIDNVGGADVFGWFGEQPLPTGISTALSQTGLDFALPLAEIHGTVTLAPGQTEARIDVSQDTSCGMEGMRPGTYAFSSGDYAIIGVYAGPYCISADGNIMGSPVRVCHGDPSCTAPTVVTLAPTEIRTGIDLDFTLTAVESASWRQIKNLYR